MCSAEALIQIVKMVFCYDMYISLHNGIFRLRSRLLVKNVAMEVECPRRTHFNNEKLTTLVIFRCVYQQLMNWHQRPVPQALLI
jgi:hypothetical protein